MSAILEWKPPGWPLGTSPGTAIVGVLALTIACRVLFKPKTKKAVPVVAPAKDTFIEYEHIKKRPEKDSDKKHW
jgi:hypothetical protein